MLCAPCMEAKWGVLSSKSIDICVFRISEKKLKKVTQYGPHLITFFESNIFSSNIVFEPFGGICPQRFGLGVN